MQKRTMETRLCERCGKPFETRACGPTRFCGVRCAGIACSGNRTHGMCYSPEWRAWRNMRQRCHSPNHADYPRYGARGIAVCERWLESFENFIEDMGPRPDKSLSIERIDNAKGYEPSNCKWGTKAEQGRNRSICWTEEQDEALRQAVAEGMNFGQAARKMGKSTMSVAARAKRIGLQSNFDPHAPRGPKQRGVPSQS